MRHYDIDSLSNRDPERIESLVRWAHRTLVPWHRYQLSGTARIPDGPALYVANHNSGMMPIDAFLFCALLHRERGIDFIPYGLGHEVAISFPLLHQLIVPLGAVRASHDTAHRLFAQGAKVLVFPGGDVDAMRPFRDRNRIRFDGRTGYLRLAMREGVPIVPLVTAGAHSSFVVLDDLPWLAHALGMDRRLRMKVLPLTLSLPWGLTLGAPPHFPLPTRVIAELLPPLRFEPQDDPDDDALVRRYDLALRSQMQAALDRLVAERKRHGLRAALRHRLLRRTTPTR